MLEGEVLLDPAAEQFHVHDPSVTTWNESWLVSWLPPDGSSAGLFRLGTLTNQGRAWLWLFLWTGAEWVAVEETRLGYDHLRRGDGVAYDQWGLSFSYQPVEDLQRGRFRLAGIGRIRTGPRSGHLVPVQIDLDLTARTPCFTTGAGRDDSMSRFPASRFEQSMSASGTVTIDGTETRIDTPAHRDRSWGPRTWQYPFMLGDLQSPDLQVYFAAAPNAEGGRGGGYVREGSETHAIASIDAHMSYDDPGATIRPSDMTFTDTRGTVRSYRIEPIAPSVQFDMAHASDPPRHWSYWRTLVRATPSTGAEPIIGWFEANRFPYPDPAP